MTGFNFNNLLNSIGKPGSTPSPQPTTALSKPPAGAPSTTKPPAATNGATPRPVSANLAAGVKRKSEDAVAGPQAKVMRTEVKVPVKPSQSSGQAASAKPSTSTASTAPYRGTSKPLSSAQTVKPAAKSGQTVAKPAAATASTATANGASAAPRGFAAIMAQAKAAQEASKAAPNTIQHKPVERLTKKERMKLREEAKQKGSTKGGKAAAVDRSRSGTPSDPKAVLKKAPETGYKGTMKKNPAAAAPASSYSGTMKRAIPGAPPKKDPKKGLGQDKYGGYASWSDLDEAEDDEEGGYDSYESDDMEAGFDDVDGEEQLALKSAKKEDLEALQEEERHKREKEERKRKLAALSKSAAAKNKKY